MKSGLCETEVEEFSLEIFRDLGYEVLYGSEVAPGERAAERSTYTEILLSNRLEQAIHRLNPTIPRDAQEAALRTITNPSSLTLIQNNQSIHEMFTDGITVEYRRPDGSIAGDRVRLFDTSNPKNNEFLVINQFTIQQGKSVRRPDIVLFINGIPVLIFELKNPTDEKASITVAHNQLQTYMREIPSFFAYNAMMVISDGIFTRIGTISASLERFTRWRTIDGDKEAAPHIPEIEVLIRGVCAKDRILDLIQSFIVFEEDERGTIIKKFAGYHQYHAVNLAIESTVKATSESGDRKCGVVWHTQGSGKSLTMVFYSGKMVLHPSLRNPTVLVITDRNDLDDQLFGTFSRCKKLIRQTPVQTEDREHLKRLLSVASGGVVFTTIQKFFPEEEDKTSYPLLSDRSNIIVIADEAHRSQYGLSGKVGKKGEMSYGFAKYIRDALPNASFIGFTGTPIELQDKVTKNVFGEYISVYDIQQAIKDKATVPIYYESRIVDITMNEQVKPLIDSEFEAVTESEEFIRKEKLRTKWAALEAIVGDEKRISQIADDLIDHYKTRTEAIEGKAMIVCMSRRICVELYQALIERRPEWDSDSDNEGAIKVVMTGSAGDIESFQKHIRPKSGRELLAKRFKDPSDPLKIAIVRDMWLTGFDVPCLHTMYIDKPMKGHTLMQAIARVNRVWKDKPGGLIVDYIGLADELKKALVTYTESNGKGDPVFDQENVVWKMMEKYEVCCQLFHGFNWSGWRNAPASIRLSILQAGFNFVIDDPDRKTDFMQFVLELSQAFALSLPHEKAIEIREDVAFFQAVRAQIVKTSEVSGKSEAELNLAVRQIVSKSIVPQGIVDILKDMGRDDPNISVFSEEFLNDLLEYKNQNVAIAALNRLLNDEIRARSRKNATEARKFSEMLENTINKYNSRKVTTKEILEELIKISREIHEAQQRGEKLGLTESELAFYDALGINDSAVIELGDEVLKQIAQDLVKSIKNNVTIDWSSRESVRAKMRVAIKRILRIYGYPPDKQEVATQTVMYQAELLCSAIAG
jgi:type I restriction enzyme R subunit